MDIKKVGELIRKRRESLNLSQGQLSYKSDLETSVIHRIEVGERKKINFEHLKKIATGLDMNYIELYKVAGIIEEEALSDYYLPDFNDKINQQIELISDTKVDTIPIYESVSAGCGYIPDSVPLEYISLHLSGKENCIGIIVSGHSMEPTITDKAVIVMKKDTELKSKDIGVFLLNGEAYVKRFFKKNNIVILYSDNSEYSPIIVDEYDDFIVCGKVIKTLNEIR